MLRNAIGAGKLQVGKHAISMHRIRPVIMAVLLIMMPGVWPREGVAGMIDDERALKIKAGMVLNFVRYAEWPADTFTATDSPIVITLLGSDELAHHIERTAVGQRAQGRPVHIQTRSWPGPGESEDVVDGFWKELRSSHMVFVLRSEKERVDVFLSELDGGAVLTVSDIEGFAERGGMLGLVIRKDKVAVDANQECIRESRVRVSSQLLRLARVVESQGE